MFPRWAPASKPCDLPILLLIGNFVKVARGSSLRTKVRLTIRCGLYMEEKRNLADTPEVWLILSAACNHEITVIFSDRIKKVKVDVKAHSHNNLAS